MQKLSINNLVRSASFFQHAGLSIVAVFLPIIAKEVTDSLFEIGIIVASFSFSQILSEIYFGKISDKKRTRLLFIRLGFLGCAITFALHYFAEDAILLLLARIGAGISTGIMVPAMIAYAYEAENNKTKVASVVSFHALGWLAGIVAAGIANDIKPIFLISSGLFLWPCHNIKASKSGIRKADRARHYKNYLKESIFVFIAFVATHWCISGMDHSTNNANGKIWC